MHNLDGVSVKVADHCAEIVWADVRSPPWGANRSCALLYREFMKCDDLLFVVRAKGNMGPRSHNRFGSFDRVKKEGPLLVWDFS